MKQTLRDHFEFFRQFRQRFETTGAVMPSSRFLARALTKPLRELAAPRRILEVGPGTGAVTREIVRQIRAGDTFDLVEINPEFANLLRERFENDADYHRARDVAEIHVCPLQEFTPDEPYDVIVSGLPFNNFPSSLVAELLDHSLGLLKPGGTLSFFEYMFVRPVRRRIAKPAEKTRLTEIERILAERFGRHRFQTDWVFVNVPPALAQHLRMDGRAAPAE
jgi:phosphatidylethanolamine/phosphatidyl-N-methylethanolamine N-methyltransferase